MRQRNRLFVGVVAGAVLSLAAALSVLGYHGQVPHTVSVTGPSGSVSCGTTSTIHALVLDTAHNPDTVQSVTWMFTGGSVAGDKISPTSTTTDSNGNTSTVVTFACAGNRVVHIQATAGDVLGSISVTVTAHGLPGTSTDPASGTSTAAILAAAFAVLLGGWIILRRVSAARG